MVLLYGSLYHMLDLQYVINILFVFALYDAAYFFFFFLLFVLFILKHNKPEKLDCAAGFENFLWMF